MNGYDENNDLNGLEGESQETLDLYHFEVDRFAATLDRDEGEAFRRYGFTMFHSLPPQQRVVLSQKLGFWKNDAIDHYNLAGLELLEENWEKAAKLLQKTLEMDGTIADAAYNLALCYERLDRKQDALNMWSRYQELSESEEDLAEVEAHIAELRA